MSATAREAGILYPVAITRAAWADCVAWDDSNKGLQDEAGRLWDVVWMLRCAVGRAARSEVRYRLYRVPNTPKATAPRLTTLKAVCGPGDGLEPVITVMLPGED